MTKIVKNLHGMCQLDFFDIFVDTVVAFHFNFRFENLKYKIKSNAISHTYMIIYHGYICHTYCGKYNKLICMCNTVNKHRNLY